MSPIGYTPPQGEQAENPNLADPREEGENPGKWLMDQQGASMGNDSNGNARDERILCWPYLLLGVFLPIISFPLVLALLMWWFRRHVDRRLQSPAFRSERFKTPEGQRIIERLHKCRGRFRNPVAVVLLLQYVFCPSLIAFQLSAVPALVPRFPYSAIFQNIVEVQPVLWCTQCQSRNHYESLSSRGLFGLRYVAVRPLTDAEAAEALPPLIDGVVVHRRTPSGQMEVWHNGTRLLPYEGWRRGNDGKLYLLRVATLGYRWRGTVVLGWILYAVFIPLQVVSAMVLCCCFWARFARHRVAELAAASHARDDPGMRDRLLPSMKRSNARLMRATFLLAPLQGWLLPFYGPGLLDVHLLEERAYQIAEALEA